MSEHFTILMVCMGNICRSPLAEFIVKAELSELGLADTFKVSSAGTYSGHAGDFMHKSSAYVLKDRGINPSGFQARALSPSMIRASDLIFTAEVGQVHEVVRRESDARTKTIALAEFGHIVSTMNSHPEGTAIDVMTQLRDLAIAQSGQVDPTQIDVADPYGMPQEDYFACADHIDLAVEPWLRIFRQL